jgi:hypothetical protein
MAKSPLAINWFSKDRTCPATPKNKKIKDTNLALPMQTVFFEFTNPPREATEVVVEVKEDVKFLTNRPARSRVIGTVEGEIKKRRFKVRTMSFDMRPTPVRTRWSSFLSLRRSSNTAYLSRFAVRSAVV